MSARWVGVAIACVTLAMPSQAQGDIAAAMRRVDVGTLRMEFGARPGVCGNGQSMNFNVDSRSRRRNGEWESECEPGPVRVAMDVRAGRPTAIRFYVGGRWGSGSGATDLGTISAREAGDWFVRLAESASASVAKDAIAVSTIADSAIVWPVLLRIAKDDSRERELRKSAVFWLGQATSDATAALNGLAEAEDEDVEVRKQAVFALSQRPDGEGVPTLLRIARGKLDARVRRQAIFWLGQSGDARALAYFENVLTRH